MTLVDSRLNISSKKDFINDRCHGVETIFPFTFLIIQHFLAVNFFRKKNLFYIFHRVLSAPLKSSIQI